jgi:hydrogenase expression/formation protein HypC
MCLAIPALVVERIEADEALIDAGGVSKRVSLALVPEAAVGDYVIVHAGFAISVLDAEEAAQTFKYLEEWDQALAKEQSEVS